MEEWYLPQQFKDLGVDKNARVEKLRKALRESMQAENKQWEQILSPAAFQELTTGNPSDDWNSLNEIGPDYLLKR